MVSDQDSTSPNWITLKNGLLIKSVTIICVDTPLSKRKIMMEEISKGRRVLNINLRHNKENQSVRNISEGLILFPVEAKIPKPVVVSEESSSFSSSKEDHHITEEELTRNEDHETLLCWAHPIDLLQENEYPIPSALPEGFIETSSKTTIEKAQHVIAIDCEMCRTKNGLELTRVTALDYSGKVLMDELVKPSSPITDYVTKYVERGSEMLYEFLPVSLST